MNMRHSGIVIGQDVTVRCPADGSEPETWMRGWVSHTLARSAAVDGFAVHVIDVRLFKWNWTDAWRLYDGVPHVIAREMPGTSVLEWIDTWPRRGV